MKIARDSLVTMVVLLLWSTASVGAARYKVTEITLPPDANVQASSWGGINKPGINNNGVVAGYYHIRGTTYDHEAFCWENGVTTVLPHLSNDLSYLTFAYAINNQGQIAGYSGTSCLWQNTNPPSPTALPGGYGNEAFGINDSGQVVGVAPNSSGSGRFAVLWDNGVRTYLPPLGVGGATEAFGINKDGHIVGMSTTSNSFTEPYWPALWREGVPTNLGDLVETPSATERGGRAYAINNLNQVVGYASANIYEWGGGYHAFLWQDNVMTDLGALSEPSDSIAFGINNVGQIVGTSGRAVLWEKGDIIDLNTRIDPIPGWYLKEARAINDKGQIVCLAIDSGAGANSRFYLMTPISSPAATNLLLLGD